MNLDHETCTACETCLERCQMEALRIEDEHAVLDENRCIGCGLCISTCPSGALSLERKPKEVQKEIPKNQMEAFALRIKAREQAKADLEDKLVRHKEA